MPAKTIEEQRKALLEKQEKLKLEIRALRSREKDERRRLETRGLVILGALVKAELEKRGDLGKYCARTVTRVQDLEVLQELGWMPAAKTAPAPAPAPAAGAGGIPIPTMASATGLAGQLGR